MTYPFHPLKLLVAPTLGIAALCFLMNGTVNAAAPQNRRDLSITDPANADADFAVQGEYLDRVLQTDGSSSFMGLQVVAQGDGRFNGVLYWGGLPGAGWDRTRWETLSGESDGELTHLQGEQHAVSIRDQVATLEDSGGTILGRLSKIHRISPTQGLAPPANAIVLFNGEETDQIQDAKIMPDGLLGVGGTTTTPVQDFRLHIEFRTPYMPYALGQRRGNSGVYIQRRYEVQVLDSFGLEGKHNECGGLYRQTPPDLNMCLPPLSWQTYDIHFTAARFDSEGKKAKNARITVYHNGEAIHDDRELPSKTGAGRPESPEPLPIHFQNHGNPVRYRNMWLVLNSPVDSTDGGSQPMVASSGPIDATSDGTCYQPCYQQQPCYQPCRPRCRLPLRRRWCR